MFAVIFEVVPKSGRREDYFELATSLKPQIIKIDGFIEVERFDSRRTTGRVLSLSIWRDEKAVVRWRTLPAHHKAQEKGRAEVFEDYHLRIGELTADSSLRPGETLPEQRLDETEVGGAKAVTLSEVSPAAGDGPLNGDLPADLGLPPVGALGLVDREVYQSLYNPGKLLLLSSWSSAAAAAAWTPRRERPGELRHRRVRIIRDYGMFDRREAPQFYPVVKRPGDLAAE
jgi:heme-degrading monooxygenase HmoA